MRIQLRLNGLFYSKLRIVEPERLVPGTSAKHWKEPILISCRGLVFEIINFGSFLCARSMGRTQSVNDEANAITIGLLVVFISHQRRTKITT